MPPSRFSQNKKRLSWIKCSSFWTKFAIYNFIIGAILLPIYRADWINYTFGSKSLVQGSRYTEGKNYVGAMTRAQQAYYLENEQFADSIEELNIGLPPETPNYQYHIWKTGKHGPFQVEIISPETIAIASARQPGLKSYSGVVWIDEKGDTIRYLCETNLPSSTLVIPDRRPGEERFKCPKGSKEVPG